MVEKPKVEAPPATFALVGSSTAAVPANDPVQKLMDLGVSREQAIVILEQTNGDVDAAASLLFM
ncbi:hypothetical protein BC829DRAFT_388962 [Chytridium lagenaria]|nr:hypothetical protein BC829DRAFT_388962 [Chytridium lagenaria]